MSKKLFITFEGIDGSGKDTQLHELIKVVRNGELPSLGDKYTTIWVTREPTKITTYGKQMSELLKGEGISGEESTKYFVNDRIEHSKIISEILDHSLVFCSRYDFSTLTYQMTQGMDFDYLYNLHGYNENKCLIPDITIVFKISAKDAMDRTKKRNHQKEFFEELEFQEKLEKNIDLCISKLRDKDNRKIIVINANQEIEEVTSELITKLSQNI